jgi:hypothetical protein
MIGKLRSALSCAAIVAASSAFAPMALAEDAAPPAVAAPAPSAPATDPALTPASTTPAAAPATTDTAPTPVNAPAATPPASPEAATATPAPTPAAPALMANGLPAPPAGKGQVVFFRRGGLVGAAIVYKVREGTTAYGTLSPGRYFVVAVDPGKHTYVVHSESKDEMTLQVDEGETYYVEGTVAMGILVGRPNLTPSNEIAFNAIAKKLKLAKPEPAKTEAAAAPAN